MCRCSQHFLGKTIRSKKMLSRVLHHTRARSSLESKSNNNKRSNICSLCLYFASKVLYYTVYIVRFLFLITKQAHRSYYYKSLSRRQHNVKKVMHSKTNKQQIKKKTQNVPILLVWTQGLNTEHIPDFKTLKSMQTGYNDLVVLSAMFWRDLEGLFLSVTNLHSLP